MQITEDMVISFNQTLENLNCSFRLKFITGPLGNGECEIILSNDMFIKSSIINLTEEFYNVLEKFFDKRGIKLSYNNTGSIFWSKKWMGRYCKRYDIKFTFYVKQM